MPSTAGSILASMADSLYIRRSDGFEPTEYARGGWSDYGQHGGPPCGLLGHAIEQVPTPVPMQVARLTFDLFREVPMHTCLTITTEVAREGRRIQVVAARMAADGVEVARATGLKIRTADLELDRGGAVEFISPGPPEDAPLVEWGSFAPGETTMTRFHVDAIEIRSFEHGFERSGRGVSWFRLKRPLVDDEPLTPLTRMATLADMSNGNSRVLDARKWLFVNPDLTLSLQRVPEGEWIGMDSASTPGTHGVGIADTMVFDRSGPCGRITQAQLIGPR